MRIMLCRWNINYSNTIYNVRTLDIPFKWPLMIGYSNTKLPVPTETRVNKYLNPFLCKHIVQTSLTSFSRLFKYPTSIHHHIYHHHHHTPLNLLKVRYSWKYLIFVHHLANGPRIPFMVPKHILLFFCHHTQWMAMWMRE